MVTVSRYGPSWALWACHLPNQENTILGFQGFGGAISTARNSSQEARYFYLFLFQVAFFPWVMDMLFRAMERFLV